MATAKKQKSRAVEADADGAVRHRGTNHHAAKLTPDDVRAIRRLYVAGCRLNGCYALSREFGVSHAVILSVVRRESWKHVT